MKRKPSVIYYLLDKRSSKCINHGCKHRMSKMSEVKKTMWKYN